MRKSTDAEYLSRAFDMDELSFQERAKAYCIPRGIYPQFQSKLGSGQEGYVWETSDGSAIKVFERMWNFEIELQCYQYLLDYDVSEIHGFHVPRLIDHEEELKIIQMSIVKEPFILDFGKCHLYRKPDFPSDAIECYDRQLEEFFGDMVDEVRTAISFLESYLIFYSDARPGNINCNGWRRPSEN